MVNRGGVGRLTGQSARDRLGNGGGIVRRNQVDRSTNELPMGRDVRGDNRRS